MRGFGDWRDLMQEAAPDLSNALRQTRGSAQSPQLPGLPVPHSGQPDASFAGRTRCFSGTRSRRKRPGGIDDLPCAEVMVRSCWSMHFAITLCGVWPASGTPGRWCRFCFTAVPHQILLNALAEAGVQACCCRAASGCPPPIGSYPTCRPPAR